LGSKENISINKTPSTSRPAPQASRYGKCKYSPLDSNKNNKLSNQSLEVKEIDHIPTIHDRFEKRRETSDHGNQLSKYEIHNERLNSFRNKCREYDKLSSKGSPQEDIQATRKITAPDDSSNSISRSKTKNSSNDLAASREIQVPDIQLLFSKKISNADKLSLLKLKMKKDENPVTSARMRDDAAARESFQLDRSSSNLNQERKTSARGTGLSTASNGLSLGSTAQALLHQRDSQKSRDSLSRVGQPSTVNKLLRPGSSSGAFDNVDITIPKLENTPRRELTNHSSKPSTLSGLQRSAKETRESIEEIARKSARVERDEKERRLKELENRLKGKRSSVPEGSENDRLARELDFHLDLKQISMTPDISRRGSLEQNRSKHPKELDLPSRLILNTLISEIGKTEDQYLETLELERKNLIDYIKSSFETTGKVPKTSLQFYKVFWLSYLDS
jgi:hypothetical protein